MKPKNFIVLLIALAFVGWTVDQGLFGGRSYPSNQVESENDRELRSGPGFDEPLQFFKFHQGVRTADDELLPGYSAGYETIELAEAKKRLRNMPFARSSSNGVIEFKERGPWNVPGRMRAILVLATDPNKNTWLAGAATGGIWKTIDGGKTWVEKSQGFSVYSISSFAMSDADPTTIYAGTGELVLTSGNSYGKIGDGIYKSTDGGETWKQLVSTAINPDFSIVSRIITDPANPNVLLASTFNPKLSESGNSKIMRSTNGGISWTEVYQSSKGIQQIISTPFNFNIQYATIKGTGVIKSTNGGISWTMSSAGMVATGRIELGISSINPNRVFASCEDSPNGSRSDLYASNDAGQTWTLVNLKINSKPVHYLGYQGFYNNHVLCDPFNENIVYVGGIDTFHVTLTGTTILADGKTKLDASTQTVTDWYGQFDSKNAQNFANLDVGGPHVDHHFSCSIITSTTNKTYKIVLATDGGIFVSKSAQNPGVLQGDWTFASWGLNTGQFYGVDKKPKAEEYIGGMQDNGTRISMRGEAATRFTKYGMATSGDGGEVVWHTTEPNKIMASSYGNLFYRSTDGGATWSSALEGFSMYQGSIDGSKYPFLSKLAYSRNVPDLLYSVGNEGVWINSNFGTSWVLSPIKEKYGRVANYFDVEVSRADPKIVWAGSGMSDAPEPRNLHVSLNSGSTFQATNNFSPVVLGNITKLATHPTQPNTAYALFSFFGRPKVIRTTDLGQSWTDISGFGTNKVSNNGFPDVAVYCLYVMPDNPDVIWVGTEIGIVESLDNGRSWALLNGFPNVSVWDMKGQDDEIVIATFGRGIWTAKMNSNQNVLPPLLLGIGTRPNQNLAIRFQLLDSYDSLQVFVKGQRIIKLNALETGTYDWNLRAVPPSVNTEVSLRGFKNGSPIQSASIVGNHLPLNSTYTKQYSNLMSAATDFAISPQGGYTVSSFGTSNLSLQSTHPYPGNTESTAILLQPIIVANTNANFFYQDVAIVQPSPSVSFGQPGFKDFVVVEATRNGLDWIPLKDGYSASANAAWQAAFMGNQSGTPAMQVDQSIDIKSKFASNDTLLFRFRIKADGDVTTGWGWSIDNLFIQQAPTGIEQSSVVSELSVYPNPTTNKATISYFLNQPSVVRILINDETGRAFSNENWGVQNEGKHMREINLESNNTGLYLIRLQIGHQEKVLKLLVK